MRSGVICALVLLQACGGQAPPPPGAGAAETALRLARADFARHRYRQAAVGYDEALDAAWRLDDATLVATAGTEGSLALLRAGESEEAYRAAVALGEELARRGMAPPPLLVLTTAAAAYRLGELDEASDRLAALDPAAASDPLIAGRHAYLEGRIAVAAGDVAGLDRSIEALSSATAAALAADRLELEARRLLMLGDGDGALVRLRELEDERRRLDQLAAVGEALALAGEAAALAGQDAQSADFYLRAARNAWVIERADLARVRLAAARAQSEGVDDLALTAAIDALAERIGDAGV